jgi:hypothetical protein
VDRLNHIAKICPFEQRVGALANIVGLPALGRQACGDPKNPNAIFASMTFISS